MIFENTEAPHYGLVAYLGTVTEADMRSRAWFHFSSGKSWHIPSKARVKAFQALPRDQESIEKQSLIPDFALDITTVNIRSFAWCDRCKELVSGIVSCYPDNDEPPVRLCHPCHRTSTVQVRG